MHRTDPASNSTLEALARIAAAGLLVAGVACKSGSHLPRTMPVTKEMRAQAEQATELGKWDVAAQRWYSIFVGSEHQDAQACAESARAMMRMGDAESALHVLRAGVAKNPDVAELHELQGDALVQQNFRRAAEHRYEEAVKTDPKRASAWRGLGSVRVGLGYEGAAVQPLERAIELGKNDLTTWILLARARNASGDPCGAYQAYVEAFRRGEGTPDQLVEASTLYLVDAVRRAHVACAEECKGWLQRALEIDPNCVQAHFELGVLEEELGNVDEAIRHYRAAGQDCLPAIRNLALLYADRRDEPNTRAMVERALKLEKDPDRRKALQHLLEVVREPQPAPKSGETP